MLDPVSVFICMWIMNAGLPEGRLNVEDTLEAKEERIVIDNIMKSVTIREGI